MTAPTGPGLRWSSLAILVISLIAWLAQTGTVHHSWNESSRLAAIESIVERGTWRIDASRYGQETGDKILWGGHYYSAKPPLFSAVGAVFYAAIYHTWGARLASEGCQPGELCVYYWLTVLLVGLPSALMAVLFYRLAARQLGAPIWAAGLTALLCFGTLVWPYSLAFNNHLIAASALLAGWYLLAHDTAGQRQVFLAGLLVSLAVMFDLTSMFVAAALFLIVVIYHRRAALFFMAAGLIPMIATLIFNYQITGTIFFPYMITTGNNFPGSVWANRDTVAALSRPDNVLLNGFYGLLGQKGLLTGTPLLIFSMAGLGRVLNNQYGRRLAVSGWLLALGFTGHLLFILSQDDILGGDNYGLRYFVPSLPLLYTFIIFVVPAWFNQPPRGHWIAGAFGLLALVSVFAAFQGTRGGAWSINPPPFYLDLQSTWPYLKPEAHLALVNPPPPRMRHGPVSYTETPAMAYP
ncbi:MAG: hypothetical protein HYR94_17190, partial [Chloroflexi bacterium]|nr:hypothetical protein [Chloroflexota bacterium]